MYRIAKIPAITITSINAPRIAYFQRGGWLTDSWINSADLIIRSADSISTDEAAGAFAKKPYIARARETIPKAISIGTRCLTKSENPLFLSAQSGMPFY